MNSELQGKVALVTGASRGIGRGIALELAGAGCDLLLTARDGTALEGVAAAVRAMGRGCEIHAADLRGEGEPARLASLAKERFGRLDILINNAGATRRGDFFTLTDADWDAGFDLKFFAQVRLCRAAWPLLKDSRRVDRRHRRHRRPRAGRRLHDRLIGDRRAACLHEGAGRDRQA